MFLCILMTLGFIGGVIGVTTGVGLLQNNPDGTSLFWAFALIIGCGILALVCIGGPIGIIAGLFGGTFGLFGKSKGSKSSSSSKGNSTSNNNRGNSPPAEKPWDRDRVESVLSSVDKTRSVPGANIWAEYVTVTQVYSDKIIVDVYFRYEYFNGADQNTVSYLGDAVNSIIDDMASAVSDSTIGIRFVPHDNGPR